MRQELQDKLRADFPDLWAERMDGFWCSDGWHDLIYNLSKQINDIRKTLTNDISSNYQVVQVKEKFSGLRYYLSSSTPEMNELISIAENKSYDICGACGGEKGPSESP